jgi:hypothetical protein
MPVGPTTPFDASARPALHLHDDAAWDAALAARDAAPAPRCAQDSVNGLFVAAREASRSDIRNRGRLTLDNIWSQALSHRGALPYPTQAALQRAWRWAQDTGLIRSGKHLASRRSFNVTPYYEWT